MGLNWADMTNTQKGLGNVNPEAMSNIEFNTWAALNPKAVSALGATGYQATNFNADGNGLLFDSTNKTLDKLNPDLNIDSTGLGLGDAMGIIKGFTGLGNLGLAYKSLGQAEDAFEFNKEVANRDYEANVQKYNNALARTAAVDKVYGTKTAGTAL